MRLKRPVIALALSVITAIGIAAPTSAHSPSGCPRASYGKHEPAESYRVTANTIVQFWRNDGSLPSSKLYKVRITTPGTMRNVMGAHWDFRSNTACIHIVKEHRYPATAGDHVSQKTAINWGVFRKA